MEEKEQREKICQYCKRKFIPNRKNQKYCSKECCTKSNYERSKNRIYKYQCQNCGKEILSKIKLKKKFCDTKCKEEYEYKNRLNELSEDLNENLNKTQVAKNVIWEIVNLKVKRFMSPIVESESVFDKALNYWELSDIPSTTKKTVLQRDNCECQICSKSTNLHIHHIIKRANGGNHNPNNLITLCDSCHRYIETADEELATKGCYKNALKYYKLNEKEKTITFEEIQKELLNIYVKCKNDEREEALYKISVLLDKLDEIGV